MLLWLAGLASRELREPREVVAQFDRPYVTDATAFETAFGPFELTSYRESFATTLAWAHNASDATPAWR